MALDKDGDMQTVEMYARFGRAFYMANVVEDQLVLTLMQLEFARTEEAFVQAKGKGFDRAKIAAEWDDYEKKQVGFKEAWRSDEGAAVGKYAVGNSEEMEGLLRELAVKL